MEDPLWKSIDGKSGLVAFLDPAHVAFAGIGVHLHLLEVRGDEKQRRRLEAGGDGLPAGHVAGHDGAVHGRDDVGVVEIELGAFDQRLVELDGRLRPG